jgi:hypothetical protein
MGDRTVPGRLLDGARPDAGSERWVVRVRTEDNLLQTSSPRAGLALTVKFRPPCSAEVVAHAGRLGQRRVWVQTLETTVHLDVHAVLVSALPDVCFGMRFFAPPSPTAETTTHRAAMRIARLSFRPALLHCLLVFVAHNLHSIRFSRRGPVVQCGAETHGHTPGHNAGQAALADTKPQVAAAYPGRSAPSEPLIAHR